MTMRGPCGPKGAQGKILLGRGVFSRLVTPVSHFSAPTQRDTSTAVSKSSTEEAPWSPQKGLKTPGASFWSFPVEGHWLRELLEWNGVLGSRTHSLDEVQNPGLAVVWGSLSVLVP